MALTLYDNWDSGNRYKVRLVLAHLGLPYRLVDLDTDRGETRTATFLAINPNGKTPAIMDQGGFDLGWFPAVRAWCARVAS